MNIEMEKQEAKLVQNKLVNNQFLLDNGFKFQKESFGTSKLTGNNYNFFLENKQVRRSIDISFRPRPQKNDYYFFAHIENTKNKEYISVDDFLKRNKICTDLSPFTLSNYSGTFEQKVDQFLVFLEKALKEHMYDILMGKKWIQIPFDWGEYK